MRPSVSLYSGKPWAWSQQSRKDCDVCRYLSARLYHSRTGCVVDYFVTEKKNQDVVSCLPCYLIFEFRMIQGL